jgi:polyphosphate kinase
MEARRLDPLKSWKISSIDKHALAKFDDYTEARNLMLRRTSTSFAPWTIARTNRKRPARIAIIKDILARFDYPGKDVDLVDHDGGIVFEFDRVLLDKGWLEG